MHIKLPIFQLIAVSAVILSLFLTGCSDDTPDDYLESYVHGRITVSADLDTTANYSGIILLVTDGSTQQPDTLLFAETQRDGSFSGTAVFKEREQYPLQIKRYGNLISASYIILAPGDTVHIEAELPEFARTRKVSSTEHDAFNVYERLQRNYARIAMFINSGEVSQDTIPYMLDTWSGLFWSVRDSYPGTLAAEYSSLAAVEITLGWDDERMLDYIGQALDPEYQVFSTLAVYGANALARKNGLDYAINYLDSLISVTPNKEDQVALQMRKIQLFGDSTRSEQALAAVRDLGMKYSDQPGVPEWTENMITDLEKFAPGKPMPEFSLQMEDGLVLSSDLLTGAPYLLEIAELADPRYQGEYPLINFMYANYAPMGLRLITVPVDEDPVLITAFFEERERNWAVANNSQHPDEELFRSLNVKAVPTRFLVDADGKIIRKYVDRDISQVLLDLDNLFN
ncbi:MAG: TlpA family protein disulfide reductase [Rhodothermaceae bacterium]|nr:TlpA family protein disulfide reductase [Rhodothermaceae bacterium]